MKTQSLGALLLASACGPPTAGVERDEDGGTASSPDDVVDEGSPGHSGQAPPATSTGAHEPTDGDAAPRPPSGTTGRPTAPDESGDSDSTETPAGDGSGETGEPRPPWTGPGVEAEVCPEIAAEGRSCALVGNHEVDLLGLRSGRMCRFAEFGYTADHDATLWEEDALYVCRSGTLQRYALPGGEVVDSERPCVGLVGNAGGVYYDPPGAAPARQVESAAAILAGDVGEPAAFAFEGSRVTADDIFFYGTVPGHSVVRLALDTGEPQPPIQLEVGSEMTRAITRLGDDLLLLGFESSNPFDYFVHRYDLSGALLETFPVSGRWRALACRDLDEAGKR